MELFNGLGYLATWALVAGAILIVCLWLGVAASTSGFDFDNCRWGIAGTGIILMFTVVSCLVLNNSESGAYKDLTEAAVATSDKLDEINKEHKNKLYMLLERELHEDKDKMIVENVDDYVKVTAKSGIYKVKFKKDAEGDVVGIDSMIKIKD
ncbi:hypothetical protein [Bacillus mycoides]|uniref:hypothetical protein n=1 Tax=Bacillus mycoides TaxID=1405 RepID=UPI003A80A54C